MIAEKLNPEYRFGSLVKISPAWLCRRGYQALLVDIDNTLLPRYGTLVPEAHIEWLATVRKRKIAVALTSNNGGKRVLGIEQQLKNAGLRIPVLAWAGKPFPRAYAGAIRLLEEVAPDGDLPLRKDRILTVGDQLFTDVLGAHWYGLPAALVRPLSGNDFTGTKLLRVLEGGVKGYLMKNGVFPEEDKESGEDS